MADGKEILGRYFEEVLNGRQLETVANYWADQEMAQKITRGCFTYFDAFPDLHIGIEEMIAEGSSVFVRSTITGTHDGEYKGIAPTGRNVATNCAEVFRLDDDGKIAGYWCLTDVASLMRQLTEEPAVLPVTA